jgi:hypothetical protein
MATITRRSSHQFRSEVRRKGFPKQIRTFKRLQDAKDWAVTVESECGAVSLLSALKPKKPSDHTPH